MELDADQMMFESSPRPASSVYEDMTFDPDPDLVAEGLLYRHLYHTVLNLIMNTI